METAWSGFGGVVIGIGLSAACGFRVILPFLGLSIAAMNHAIPLAPEFQWVATWPALIAFATAAARRSLPITSPGWTICWTR
jgi:hypothetical protein